MTPREAPCGLWAGCSEEECERCSKAPQIVPCEEVLGVQVPWTFGQKPRSDARTSMASRHRVAEMHGFALESGLQ